MLRVLNVDVNDDETLYSSSESGDVVLSVLLRFLLSLFLSFLLLRAVLIKSFFFFFYFFFGQVEKDKE